MRLLHQLALLDPVAPLGPAGQGIGFRDIPWGSDPQTVTNRLLAAGIHRWEEIEAEEPSPHGDLSFYYDDGASLTAVFADGALVSLSSILAVAEGTRHVAYHAFRDALVARHGPPEDESGGEDEGWADWLREETGLSLSSGGDQDGEYLSLLYTGPGYQAEYRRRRLAAGTLHAPLEPGWTVVSEDVASRVAFDRATFVASGRGLCRASVRTDHVDCVHDPDLHDGSVREVEVDCASRRLRVLSAVYRLEDEVMYEQPPGRPGDWIAARPGSADALLVAALCAASQRG
jgi:hypothetical protein